MTLDYLIKQLKINGYKTTETRRALLETLLENSQSVITADELYNLAKSKNKKINRSTVYRNLEILESLDLLHKSLSDQGIARVKILCSTKHHHHLICDSCGKIVIYEHCENEQYQRFAGLHGFVLTGHTLELHGLCDKCKPTS